jgi:hypothetical protein
VVGGRAPLGRTLANVGFWVGGRPIAA